MTYMTGKIMARSPTAADDTFMAWWVCVVIGA
jgi:hypothetical protein